MFEFLEEAAKICRMHVYTMGDKNYAHEMASLIDPEGKYFHGRIIGNSDSTCSKTKDLDIVLGGDDCTMIVDDRAGCGRDTRGISYAPIGTTSFEIGDEF